MSTADKIRNNIAIYQEDLKTIGLYWSIIRRFFKIPHLKALLLPIVNELKPDSVTVHGHKMYIDKKDEVVSQQLLLTKQWEPIETKVFFKHIKKGDIVLDIGAHIGYFTLLAARKVGSKGKVYSFEPDPRNFDLLSKNVSVSGYHNVVLVQKAVSSKPGKGWLQIDPINSGNNQIITKGGKLKKRIELTSLDKYFPAGARINLIKMDVQGHEYQVLKGAKIIIGKQKRLRVISEFCPGSLRNAGSNPKAFLRLLSRLEFKVNKISESGPLVSDLTEKDIKQLFDSEDKFLNLFLTKGL